MTSVFALPHPRPRYAHVFPKAARQHYVEPLWVLRRVFEVENFDPLGSDLHDYACGWGRILRSAADTGYSAAGFDICDTRKIEELQLGGIPFTVRDFLKPFATIDRPVSIVSNPPFDHIEAFCRRALEIAKFKTAMFCPLPRVPAARWLRELPLQTIYLLSPRPSVPPAIYLEAGRKPQGGRPEYAWLIFTRNWTGTPELKWLCRDGGCR